MKNPAWQKAPIGVFLNTVIYCCIDKPSVVISPLFIIWPASREKGPSDILHNVDQDQPLNDVENIYT